MEAVALAAAMAAEGFPWLAGQPRYLVASAVRRVALAGWTAEDVRRHVATRYRGAEPLARPVAYLRAALQAADLEHPPAQDQRAAALAEAAAIQERTLARREQWDARAAAMAGPDSAGRRAARQVALRVAPASVRARARAESVTCPACGTGVPRSQATDNARCGWCGEPL